MLKELLQPDIEKLIAAGEWDGIIEAILEFHPSEISELIQDIDKNNIIKFFRRFPAKKSSEVFPYLEKGLQIYLLKNLPRIRIKNIFLEMSPDDRTEILEDIKDELRYYILKLLPRQEFIESRRLLSYPEDSIGRLMTPEFIAINQDWTVSKAFSHIRKYGKEKETISTIYIIDDAWNLIDDLNLYDLILAAPNAKIKNLLDYEYFYLSAYDDQEKSVEEMKKYDLTVMPVVDNGKLVGIITIDDIMDVAEEEATEDIHKQFAVAPIEENYSDVSILNLFKKRVVWLIILLIWSSTISASIISFFQNTLSKVITLSFFLTVIVGSGGNIGTQASALMVRALAIGDVDIGEWFKLFIREMFVGILLGITLGGLLYLRTYFLPNTKNISIVVGLSIVSVSVWSNIIGTLLPMFLKKINLDPAVVSSPLLSSVLDSTGLIIYFYMAKLILNI